MNDAPGIERMLDSAIEHHEARQYDLAEPLYRGVLEADPENADALSLLGLVLQEQGAFDESIALISKAIELEPAFADAYANLARGLRMAGKPAEAVEAGQRAVELDPDLHETWLQLGYAQLESGRYAEAQTALRKAWELTPVQARSLAEAGIAAAVLRMGDFISAARQYRSILRAHPDDIPSMIWLGVALNGSGQIDEALAVQRRAVAQAPGDIAALTALATTLHAHHDADECAGLCRRILAAEPERIDVLALLAACAISLGHFDEAKSLCRQVLALQPDLFQARQQLLFLGGDEFTEADYLRHQQVLDDPRSPVGDRIRAGFTLGGVLEKNGDYDGAFAAFSCANAVSHAWLKATGKGYRPDQFRAYVDWAIASFQPDTLIKYKDRGNGSELPVFIVGMPRSGTSLVEQIAASHSQVHGAGERRDIMGIINSVSLMPGTISTLRWNPSLIRSETARHVAKLQDLDRDAARIIDKLPDNIQILGQIAILFPGARFIVCNRDIRDVCVSCFATYFAETIDWACDLSNSGSHAREVERLMRHWRAVLPNAVLDVTYEDLIANPEAESRRLIEFLGLQWEPACLQFHKTERAVRTASVLQVREPIYNRSIGRWRHYEPHLGPLLSALAGGTAGPPVNPDAFRYLQLGTKQSSLGEHLAAIQSFQSAIAHDPGSYDAFHGLGAALAEMRDIPGAFAAWRAASDLRPDQAELFTNMGRALSEMGQHQEAITAQRRAIAIDPTEPAYHHGLATALWRDGDIEGARDAFLQTLARAPSHPTCLIELARCEAALGHDNEAEDYFRRSIEAHPNVMDAWDGLLRLNRTIDPADLPALYDAFNDAGRTAADRATIGTILGRALDQAGDYEAAFAAFRMANAIRHEDTALYDRAYQGAAFAGEVDALISLFPAQVFTRLTGSGDPSELPIFLMGTPGSGIGAVERLLSRHGRIFTAGERLDLFSMITMVDNIGTQMPPEAWTPAMVRQEGKLLAERLRALESSGNAARVVDNLFNGPQWLGYAGVLLPNARIIRCRRDPDDLALSCYFSNIEAHSAWSDDMADIRSYLRQIGRLLDHWCSVLPNPILEVTFEDLMNNPETERRRVMAFAGLDADANSLGSDPWSLPVFRMEAGDSPGRWAQYRQFFE